MQLELLTIDIEGEDTTECSDEPQVNDSYSFLPLAMKEPTEDNDGVNPIEWPDNAGPPLNEFRTPCLGTQAFPILFPYGTGDPTNPGCHHAVSLTEGFKHLMRYGERTASNNLHWRSSNHTRSPYWALNMKIRHQLISQAKVYLHHYPGDPPLTVEELRTMVNGLSSVETV